MTSGHAVLHRTVMVLPGVAGAADAGHPSGHLAAHLEATYALLTQWQAPEPARPAGLMRALYGSFGFELEQALAPLTARPAIIDMLGEEAEAIIYFSGACDRAFCYPQMARSDTPSWRDRFTGGAFQPHPSQLTAFGELTLANELVSGAA